MSRVQGHHLGRGA